MRDQITALEWVDKYGGIVRPITVTFETEDDGVFEKTYPISADYYDRTGDEVATDLPLDFYKDLVPDQTGGKRSLVYWENRSGVQIETERVGAKRAFLQCSCDIRLVAWLDLAGLGLLDQFGAVDKLKFELIATLDKKHGSITFENIVFNRFKMAFSAAPAKDENIFSNYTYDKPQTLFAYPYDFFALDFKTTWRTHKNCITSYNNLDPVCFDPVYVGNYVLADHAANETHVLTDFDQTTLIDFT